MATKKLNLYLKILIIFGIILLLLIPTIMIRQLIGERELLQDEAINEISLKWAKKQIISGPFLTIPFSKNEISDTVIKKKYKYDIVKENLHILPEELFIKAKIIPEKRYRGIYEVVVYQSKINVEGKFLNLKKYDIAVPTKSLFFEEAKINVGITDLRGIEEQIKLEWNKETTTFNPGVSNQDIVESGINSNINITQNDSLDYYFSFELNLKGSQLLYFTPLGKITDVDIESNWKNPKFNGEFLPDNRSITDSGFVAKWNILNLNRNFPQIWTNKLFNIDNSEFGVDLILPLDNYKKTYRSIKYAFLVIFLTFISFFFIELIYQITINPIQYALVGLALLLFYSLLLSISENLNFNLSFFIASIATIIMIGAYSKAIIKNNKLVVFISGILTLLYSFIFVIIQLQDYALLIGSIGLFVILGFIMYFSKKIDWNTHN